MDAVTRFGSWFRPSASPAPPDAWALWRAASGGDEASAAALVRQLTPAALALARRMLGRPEDAEDAVQDAFVRLWRSRAADGHGAQLSTYFHTIVLNRCRSVLSGRREWAMDDAELTALQEAEASHTPAVSPTDAARLADALQRLPPRQRLALAMWAYADAPVGEIARALEIDANAAHQLLHRAKRTLRSHYDDDGAPP